MSTKTLSSAPPKTALLGTFSGVFLPTLLTILGVILFLRVGTFIGTCGITKTVVVISFASLITLLTSLSISSTATNMRIGHGGVYYLLSRTFGIELGSTIGVPLFIAQALSIAFYIAGFTETLHMMLPQLSPELIAGTTLALLTGIALFSTSSALKTQTIILILIVCALGSLFFGSPITETTTTSSLPSLPFWALFALFFPAVTGIESGLSMSGDLKNPSKALPIGIIAAVVIGYITYLGIALFLNQSAPNSLLAEDSMVMTTLSFYKPLIYAGIFGATLSGALSGLLAAPRTLDALSRDKVMPSTISKWSDISGSPKLALLITSCITLAGLMIGSIDRIAPALTLFFLLAYGVLNFATGIEAMMANPSWRPTLKIHWSLSLFAALLCFIALLMINPALTLIAYASLILFYGITKKRNMESNWDDVRSSMLMSLCRFATYRLADAKPSAKSWRPNFLVFCGDPLLRSHLTHFAGQITGGKGFMTLAAIVDHKFDMQNKLSLYKSNLSQLMRKEEIPSIVEVLKHDNVMHGMQQMIDAYGLGPLTPNTVVLGATKNKDHFNRFAAVVKSASARNKNVIIIKEGPLSHEERKEKKIDVWWRGQTQDNSNLSLVLAYMLQRSAPWKHSSLSLKTIVWSDEAKESMQETLNTLSLKQRIHVKPDVIMGNSSQDLFEETLLNASKDSDLIFMGLRAPEPDESLDEYAAYYAMMLEKTKDFPPIAFVLANELLDFSLILN